MKELLREVENVMRGELNRANEKRGLFKSEHEGGFVILEEVQEADTETKRVKVAFAQLAEHIFKDEYKQASRSAKKLREAALFAACEYIQVAAMAEKYNIKDDIDKEYIDYLFETCPEAMMIEAPSYLKDNPDVIEACKKLTEVLNKAEKEAKDAE